jgi:hypothetical protein
MEDKVIRSKAEISLCLAEQKQKSTEVESDTVEALL